MKTTLNTKLFFAALITLAASSQSCEWNSDKYDTFVREDGTVQKCPTDSSNPNAQLLYIEKLNSVDDNNDSEEPIDESNTIRCAKECNAQNSFITNCVPLTDSRCSDYKEALEHGICPINKDCLHNSDTSNNVYNYCGQEIINCKTKDDCKKQGGWADYTCENNKCIATACDNLTHLINGTCETDTPEACGDDLIDCNKSIANSSSTKCSATEENTDGSIKYKKFCEVLTCKTRFHVHVNEENATECEEDDVNNCGGINCKLLAGWSEGICNDNAQCQSTKCEPGWHPYNKSIDGNFISCDVDTDANCGKIGKTCTSSTGEIRNCVQGKCSLRGCTDGYHKSIDENRVEICKIDDKFECGSVNIDCTKLAGANIGTVECKGVALCSDSQCSVGYHTTGTEGLNPCEPDTNDNCGPKHKKCSGETPYCNYSDSQAANCSNKCGNDLTFCIDGCYNTQTSVYHCGDTENGGCGIDCTNQFANANAKCENGSCKLDSCKSGYHLDQTSATKECVEDNIDNCGGKNCNESAPEHASAESCMYGSCIYHCDQDYINCHNTCIRSKGNHLKTCDTCESGYGDCDNILSNGCETKLSDFGLKTCNTCSSEYTECGTHNIGSSNTIPLCLKQGNYYSNHNGNSNKLESCSTYYSWHKDYNYNGYAQDNCNNTSDSKYINYEYQGGNVIYHRDRYQNHNYKEVHKNWEPDIYSWSSEHCALACNSNTNISNNDNGKHTDASGKTIEAWSRQCQPKQTCHQYNAFAVDKDYTNYNHFYVDYGCSN